VGGCIAVTYRRKYRDNALKASTTEGCQKAPGRAGMMEIEEEKEKEKESRKGSVEAMLGTSTW